VQHWFERATLRRGMDWEPDQSTIYVEDATSLINPFSTGWLKHHLNPGFYTEYFLCGWAFWQPDLASLFVSQWNVYARESEFIR